ncbi:MAG: hypothetical protein AAFQ64_06640 [Pseudomonadota bacterium]
MKLKSIAAATLLFTGVATGSHAMTSIQCVGYTIVLPEQLAIAAEVRAGSTRAMESTVCDRSSSTAEELYEEDNPHRIAVDIEELGLATYVLIFSRNDDSKPD